MYQWSVQLKYDPQLIPSCRFLYILIFTTSLLVQEYVPIAHSIGTYSYTNKLVLNISMYKNQLGVFSRFLYILLFTTSLLVQECVPMEWAIGI